MLSIKTDHVLHSYGNTQTICAYCDSSQFMEFKTLSKHSDHFNGKKTNTKPKVLKKHQGFLQMPHQEHSCLFCNGISKLCKNVITLTEKDASHDSAHSKRLKNPGILHLQAV